MGLIGLDLVEANLSINNVKNDGGGLELGLWHTIINR